jgi:acylphosphatase
MVQGVGYRAYVRAIALQLGITGTVRNLRDGSVEIYARGPEETMNLFIEYLRKHPRARIKEIKVYEEGTPEYGEGPGEWDGFLILSRDGTELPEYAESLEFVILGGIEVAEEVKKLGEKVDSGFAELKEEIRATREELKDEIRATREELGEKLDTSIRRTEEFHTETAKRFDYLDAKYGQFGARMSELERDIKEMKDIMKEMKDAFIRLVNHVTGK